LTESCSSQVWSGKCVVLTICLFDNLNATGVLLDCTGRSQKVVFPNGHSSFMLFISGVPHGRVKENKLPKSSRCKTKPHWPPPGDKTIRSIAEDYRDNSAVHSSELQGHSVHFDNFLRIIRDSAITLKLRQCQFRLLQFSVCKMLVNSSVCVLFSLCLQSVTFTILRAIVCHVTISFLFPVFH